MGLRAVAMPFIRCAEAIHRRPRLRRLMVEARQAFDDRVRVDGGEPPIRLHVGSRMEDERATSFFTKEPETIAWLDGLEPGDLFVDIGANVGVYSLYAAVRRGARVLAFEPEAQNFAALNRNINANDVSRQVTAYPIALSASAGPTVLNLSHFATGASHHNIGEPVGESGERYEPAFVQGSISMTLDDALAAIAPGSAPRAVKIDVDGVEPRIVDGMPKLLADRRLHTVLIELLSDGPATAGIRDRFEAAGFGCQPPAATYKGRGNWIFRRHGTST